MTVFFFFFYFMSTMHDDTFIPLSTGYLLLCSFFSTHLCLYAHRALLSVFMHRFPVRSALTSALDFGVPVLLLSRMAGLGSTCGVIDLEIPSLLLCVFAFHHCVLVPIPSNDSFQEESITR
jgi:hypothetical protein